jgi:hypothetical protein
MEDKYSWEDIRLGGSATGPKPKSFLVKWGTKHIQNDDGDGRYSLTFITAIKRGPEERNTQISYSLPSKINNLIGFKFYFTILDILTF